MDYRVPGFDLVLSLSPLPPPLPLVGYSDFRHLLEISNALILESYQKAFLKNVERFLPDLTFNHGRRNLLVHSSMPFILPKKEPSPLIRAAKKLSSKLSTKGIKRRAVLTSVLALYIGA